MTKESTETGKDLEHRVVDAYRRMGARKVEHDIELASNEIDIYVELADLHAMTRKTKVPRPNSLTAQPVPLSRTPYAVHTQLETIQATNSIKT